MSDGLPWGVLGVLVLLGAYHGVNPGMGWLFALSLGLQQRSRKAVLRALVPIALGHAIAIALTLGVVSLLEFKIPFATLKFLVAAILFALGLYRVFRSRHPRGAGMRVGFRDLTVWSFLMASAHGAGLMLAPVLLATPLQGMHHSMNSSVASNSGVASSVAGIAPSLLALAVLVHTVGLILVAGVVAILFYQFYEKRGLGLLRHTWFNFDLLWAFALIIAGVAALVV
ncbi:hypothetical protein [Edaphobacter modestus]|uniref:Uncharacterized protein n=1 Tax=Edaphobacter modestus TaxID=388466 RepID=A0A4Q7YZ82_9BACT|nr:hypothetical protein [Edaphobacter modestus]RZU42479.1 hypothetical protein BDD14_4069 [Edaphobacter modestus]